ncbi:MAG: hypothetical protein K1X64_15580 [Myxococcaceae bacterium]|nr:hypothetical protein [Myxococcaceae bacterium]
MTAFRDLRELVLHLHALGGGPEVVRKAAARVLADLPPTDATELLKDLLKLARTGWEPATCVLPAFTRALDMEAADIPYAASLKRVAALQEQPEVELLFTEGDARKTYDPGLAAKADSKLFSQSLGYLKQKARLTRNADEMSRLAAISEPSVIANLLQNPRLTEDVVVRIAARRPARPEPLMAIWRSARWSVRPMVRRALVFNPYLPPDVASKIVPLLSVPDLNELANDGGVHPSLREQARALLALQPR